MKNFCEFYEARFYARDLSRVVDDGDLVNVPGYVFPDNLFVFALDGDNESRTEVILGNESRVSCLADNARYLYEWAVHEGRIS